MRTAWTEPAFTWPWLPVAWLLILLSALAIRCLPLRHMAPFFGENLGAVAFLPLADPTQYERARRIRRVISLAARLSVFRSDCYPQALAARLLAGLHGIPTALHFGVAYADGDASPDRRLRAHAWVVSGPVALSGGNVSFQTYPPVSCFVSTGRPDRPKRGFPMTALTTIGHKIMGFENPSRDIPSKTRPS